MNLQKNMEIPFIYIIPRVLKIITEKSLMHLVPFMTELLLRMHIKQTTSLIYVKQLMSLEVCQKYLLTLNMKYHGTSAFVVTKLYVSLSDLEEIKRVAMTIRDNYAAEGNYCIFFAYGSYDLPESKGNDSEEVYPFLLILIQPCCLSKPGIKYDSPKNEFTNRMVEPMLNPPIYTFLYPALDSLHTVSNTMDPAIALKNSALKGDQ